MARRSAVARVLHCRPAMTPASGRQPRRIVLVDDEEALAWSLASRLAKLRPRDVVETANDGMSALALMHEKPADLLIADIRMPTMSGIDLVLAARHTTPSLPVIIMTAFQPIDINRLAAGPFTGFLEKPFEFERLVELVSEALAPAKVGFSGAISVQTLPDVVQLYALSGATGSLLVKHDEEEGELWFELGGIPHAATRDKKGDEAVFEILMWSGGEFSMRLGPPPPERSVVSSWQELLIESCRRVDEQKRNKKHRASRPGWAPAFNSAPPPPPPPPATLDDFDRAFDDLISGAASSVTLEARPKQPHLRTKEVPMNIKDSLAKLNSIDGFVGAALVDSESGMLLGQEGGGALNLEVAAAGNTEVVRAKRKTMANLALKDGIEDILITLGKAYHLIRPLRGRPTLFFYLALDRSRANLAMARIGLADVEKDLQV